MTSPRPVTGPDGDNPITDEQIEAIRAGCSPVGARNREICELCNIALNRYSWLTRRGIRDARRKLAEIHNARLGKEGR